MLIHEQQQGNIVRRNSAMLASELIDCITTSIPPRFTSTTSPNRPPCWRLNAISLLQTGSKLVSRKWDRCTLWNHSGQSPQHHHHAIDCRLSFTSEQRSRTHPKRRVFRQCLQAPASSSALQSMWAVAWLLDCKNRPI
jgi:hypothetical protein